MSAAMEATTTVKGNEGGIPTNPNYLLADFFLNYAKKITHELWEIIFERWEIRSAGQKIEKSNVALDGHGDEVSGSNDF